MGTRANDATEKFRDDNNALFRERTELKNELERLEVADELDASTRRRVRMLRRRIDEVTSQIVSYNMGLVRSYTRRFGGTASAEDRADFESAGLLGLMRAVDSYDPDCGTFGQWAFKPIQREVLKAVRDTDHPNLNLGDFEKRPAILRAQRDLKAIDPDYQPPEDEIAAAAGVTAAQVRRVLAPPRLTSINQPVGDGETDVSETIESGDPRPEATIISKLTLTALGSYGLTALDSRELYVIVRRFGLDGEPLEKLTEIGETLALSREAVRQIESKALAKLQHPIVLMRLSKPDSRPQLTLSH